MNEVGWRSAMAPADRILCGVGGALLFGRGIALLFARRQLAGGTFTLTGGALIARGALAASTPIRKVRVVATASDEARAEATDQPARQPRAADPTTPPAATAADLRTDDARIDEASEGSFPASDPPSWTTSGAGSPRHRFQESRRR